MPHHAGHRILVVSKDRTSIQTSRINAMMAGRGDMLLNRGNAAAWVGLCRREEQSDGTPGFIVIQPI
jgi:hypothetical protein